MDEKTTNGTPHVTDDDNESNIVENKVEIDMLEKLNELENIKIESTNDCCYEASKRIDFDKCEDYKEVCLSVDMLDCQTRLLRVFVDIHNVCENRFLAISVVLVKSKNNMIISQKGKIVFTGTSMTPCKAISKEFCFTLPGNLCEDPCPIDIKLVANYIYTNPLSTLPSKDTPCGC
ncbi:hypothetical protein RDV78_04760 [Bacillota bacterium LX-D]|nr:hypothetical protein [Bacillota bacterium LX-D]